MAERIVVEEDASEILDTLEQVEKRLQELKAEKAKLLEANQMLVDLVTHLEDELEGYIDQDVVTDFSSEEYTYSFQQGWQTSAETHEDRLNLTEETDVDESGEGAAVAAAKQEDGIDVAEIERQINEVRESIKRIEQFEGG